MGVRASESKRTQDKAHSARSDTAYTVASRDTGFIRCFSRRRRYVRTLSSDDVDCNADPALRPDDRLDSSQFPETQDMNHVGLLPTKIKESRLVTLKGSSCRHVKVEGGPVSPLTISADLTLVSPS